MDIHQVLLKYWGYSAFRPLQEDIINAALKGEDTLALLPTGGGKSICFQVPALAMDGICVVISPLIALMKDQVENLQKRDIKAIAIYSGMTKREIDTALDNCVYGKVKFLYVSPERLETDIFKARLEKMNVNLFAIDESHCISQWGYDFRPSYLNIIKLREMKPGVPFLALTATATPEVVLDIQQQLGFKKENVLQKSFERKNLSYVVLNEEDKNNRLLKILNKVKGTSVVYVRSRKKTKEIAHFLINNGVSADFYHAGLINEERSRKQLDWINNKIRVIVSTNAFGMGIDKPDVRTVVHLDLPDSLEAYFQEAGRAGRDEKKSFAVLLYHEADRIKLEKTFNMSFPTLEEIAQIYFHLGNYYQLAYGAGEGLVVEFNIGDFCKRFQLNALKAIAALKFLENDEWISLSESVFLPSRIRFEINAKDLYRFQVEHINMDVLIKTILRTYGAAFDYYINIEEADLARKLNVSMHHIVSLLQKMEELKVISYLARTDNPQIQFLRPRSDSNHLQIDHKYIAERKKVMRQQLDGIFNYLIEDQCRSRKLLAYFGELNSSDCLICDFCIKTRRQGNLKDTHMIMIAEIKNLLLNGPLTIDELVNGLSVGEEKDRLDFIRKLIDSGEIKMNNGKYY